MFGLNDNSWLNGFDGTNDEGIFLIVGDVAENGKPGADFKTLTWKPRKPSSDIQQIP